jgi:hypothetical protein
MQSDIPTLETAGSVELAETLLQSLSLSLATDDLTLAVSLDEWLLAQLLSCG